VGITASDMGFAMGASKAQNLEINKINENDTQALSFICETRIEGAAVIDFLCFNYQL
jgi:hypothetical protein